MRSLPSDDRGLAAYWGEQARLAIRDALANPRPSTAIDMDLEHAVRCARIAVWHAMKALGIKREWS